VANRHLISGHPADAIALGVAQIRADILVLGCISRSGLQRLLIGNTAEQLIYRVPCDLLMIKPVGFSNHMERERHDSANPLVVQRARDAVEEQLRAKGFGRAATNTTADFAVDFTIGSRERTEVDSYPPPYAGRWWALDDWWGHPYWAYQVDVRQYREGTLSVDVFDAHSHKPVWHGWAKKELTRSDIEHSQKPINEAVREILSNFPPVR
jgi:Domain of unknown function (DUF4136)/Universal stress protein family